MQRSVQSPKLDFFANFNRKGATGHREDGFLASGTLNRSQELAQTLSYGYTHDFLYVDKLSTLFCKLVAPSVDAKSIRELFRLMTLRGRTRDFGISYCISSPVQDCSRSQKASRFSRYPLRRLSTSWLIACLLDSVHRPGFSRASDFFLPQTISLFETPIHLLFVKTYYWTVLE